MGEAVYRIEALRDKVVALLSARPHPMKLGAIAEALDLPTWAVSAALVSALEEGPVEFCNSGYFVEITSVAPVNVANAAIKHIAIEVLL